MSASLTRFTKVGQVRRMMVLILLSLISALLSLSLLGVSNGKSGIVPVGSSSFSGPSPGHRADVATLQRTDSRSQGSGLADLYERADKIILVPRQK